MKAAIRSLWPEAPRLRPLRPGEALAPGQAVIVEGWSEARPFRSWMDCGKSQRFALVDSGRGFWYTVPAEKVRLPA